MIDQLRMGMKTLSAAVSASVRQIELDQSDFAVLKEEVKIHLRYDDPYRTNVSLFMGVQIIENKAIEAGTAVLVCGERRYVMRFKP